MLNHQFHCARISRHARRRLRPSRTRAYFSPHPKLRLPEKNARFRANPNIQMTSIMYKNAAFMPCFRQIPRVQDVKTKLSCDASFKFETWKMWKRSCRARLSFKFQELKMRPHVFDAAVPMKKVFQHMQNTIAKHNQRKKKIKWNHQFH